MNSVIALLNDCRMIPLMKNSLCLADQHGQTILHKCCDMLRQDMPRTDFFLDCLKSLMDYATMQGWGERSIEHTCLAALIHSVY